jgi:hypothetical protein
LFLLPLTPHTGRITGEQFEGSKEILKQFRYKWRHIGTNLGFKPDELDAIESNRLLLGTAPLSRLFTMLSDWHQWTPTDTRGSKRHPTLHSLRTAVSKAGLVWTAEELDKLQGKYNNN